MDLERAAVVVEAQLDAPVLAALELSRDGFALGGLDGQVGAAVSQLEPRPAPPAFLGDGHAAALLGGDIQAGESAARPRERDIGGVQ